MSTNPLKHPLVLDRPASGDAFRVQVECSPIPTPTPKDVLEIVNPAHHESRTAGRVIRQFGTQQPFNLSCGWDVNPFKHVFAKPRHLPLNTAMRTGEVTWRRIGDLLV